MYALCYAVILTRTNFSESPRHFETIVLEQTLKKVTLPWVSVHRALAIRVLPVPIKINGIEHSFAFPLPFCIPGGP